MILTGNIFKVECTIYVEVDGVPSSMLPIVSGIPQGSILGPIFAVLKNDLPNAIKYSSIYLFADDSKGSRQISSNTN